MLPALEWLITMQLNLATANQQDLDTSSRNRPGSAKLRGTALSVLETLERRTRDDALDKSHKPPLQAAMTALRWHDAWSISLAKHELKDSNMGLLRFLVDMQAGQVRNECLQHVWSLR